MNQPRDTTGTSPTGKIQFRTIAGSSPKLPAFSRGVIVTLPENPESPPPPPVLPFPIPALESPPAPGTPHPAPAMPSAEPPSAAGSPPSGEMENSPSRLPKGNETRPLRASGLTLRLSRSTLLSKPGKTIGGDSRLSSVSLGSASGGGGSGSTSFGERFGMVAGLINASSAPTPPGPGNCCAALLLAF